MNYISHSKRRTGFTGLGRVVTRSIDDPRGHKGIESDLNETYDHVVTSVLGNFLLYKAYELFTHEEDAFRYTRSHGFEETPFFIRGM